MREPPSSPGDGRKPGQSATPCGPGAARRPYRHPDPRWRRRVGGGSGRPVATASGQAATARVWPRDHARAAALRPAPDLPWWSDAHFAGDVTHPARRTCGRARQARPIAVIVPAVGLARGEERRSGDRPAGPASLIEHNQPTGVTTGCGLRCLAGLRQRLDAVACLCIKSNSSVRGSARIAPACHRNVVLDTQPWRFVPCGGVCSS